MLTNKLETNKQTNYLKLMKYFYKLFKSFKKIEWVDSIAKLSIITKTFFLLVEASLAKIKEIEAKIKKILRIFKFISTILN